MQAGMNFSRKNAHALQQCLIPAFLSVDVEPDGFQLSRSDPPKWDGYASAFELTEWLRSKLLQRSGKVPTFGWYFRTDPQIAEVYGRADYVLTEFSGLTERLRDRCDYFGVHSHPVRWCKDRNLWIHDFADAAWNTHCARFSLAAYAQWSGAPAQRFRGGAGFLSNEIIAAIDQGGVKVDLTLEPVAAWPSTFSEVPSGIDTSPYIGIHTDCLSAPQVPYRPSHNDFRVAKKDGRDLILVPVASYVPLAWQPLWRGLLQRVLPNRRPQERRVLHLANKWPSGDFYWNLVTRQICSMRRPYLSLAIRTDAPGSVPLANARKLLEALIKHPLAERLHFLDPVDVAPTLI